MKLPAFTLTEVLISLLLFSILAFGTLSFQKNLNSIQHKQVFNHHVNLIIQEILFSNIEKPINDLNISSFTNDYISKVITAKKNDEVEIVFLGIRESFKKSFIIRLNND